MPNNTQPVRTLLHESQCMMGTSTMTILKYWLRRGFGHEQTMTSVRDRDLNTLRLATTGRNSLPPCYNTRHNITTIRQTFLQNSRISDFSTTFSNIRFFYKILKYQTFQQHSGISDLSTKFSNITEKHSKSLLRNSEIYRRSYCLKCAQGQFLLTIYMKILSQWVDTAGLGIRNGLWLPNC